MKRDLKIRIYSSFEEENRAEYVRRAKMTYQERMKEFAILQERRWGSKWTSEPMVKIASFEKTKW